MGRLAARVSRCHAHWQASSYKCRATSMLPVVIGPPRGWGALIWINHSANFMGATYREIDRHHRGDAHETYGHGRQPHTLSGIRTTQRSCVAESVAGECRRTPCQRYVGWYVRLAGCRERFHHINWLDQQDVIGAKPRARTSKHSTLASKASYVGDVLGYRAAVALADRRIPGESEMSHDPVDGQPAAFSRFSRTAISDSTYV